MKTEAEMGRGSREPSSARSLQGLGEAGRTLPCSPRGSVAPLSFDFGHLLSRTVRGQIPIF